MMRHLFRAINELFRPNTEDETAREEPIFLNKIQKFDVAWSMQKLVLRWAIDTVQKVPTLSDERKRNLIALLDTIAPIACRCSRRRLRKLLWILRSTVPTISGAAGVFNRLYHALKTSHRCCIYLSALLYIELTLL